MIKYIKMTYADLLKETSFLEDVGERFSCCFVDRRLYTSIYSDEDNLEAVLTKLQNGSLGKEFVVIHCCGHSYIFYYDDFLKESCVLFVEKSLATIHGDMYADDLQNSGDFEYILENFEKIEFLANS